MKAHVSVLLDKRCQRKDGTYPIKIAVYYGGSNKRYGTSEKISMSQEDWTKINSARLRNGSLQKIRNCLSMEKSKVQDIIRRLGDDFSYEMFEALFLNKKNSPVYSNQLYGLFQKYIDDLRKNGRIGTASSYELAMKSLKNYSPQPNYLQITPVFLKNYEQWMIQKGKSLATVGVYLRSLRAILNIAKDMKLITNEMYPFGLTVRHKYEIPTGNNIKKALSSEEVRKIQEFDCESRESEFYRDLWLFSFYCNGMNMSDVFSLKNKNIDGDFIYFRRTKTLRTDRNQRPVEVHILQPARNILNKWRSKDRNNEENYVFTVYTQAMTPQEKFDAQQLMIRKINSSMERLRKKLGISKKMSTIVARHTWATLLKNSGTSIEEISEGLGHTSIETTKRYLDSFSKEHKKETAQKLLGLLNE